MSDRFIYYPCARVFFWMNLGSRDVVHPKYLEFLDILFNLDISLAHDRFICSELALERVLILEFRFDAELFQGPSFG